MSTESPTWNPELDAYGLKFAIVVARFNEAITKKLLEGARAAFSAAGAEEVDVFHVPGAFELPFAARSLAHRDDAGRASFPARSGYNAIVALGAVIRGDTPHFDYVAGECARGIQQVMLETGVPIAFGVLTTDTQQQAEARAGGSLGNKGYDAAMTAVEMARFGMAQK